MTVPYNKFTYITPPRAANAQSLDKIDKQYSSPEWIAQVKKNGTNSVIFVSPAKQVTAMGRHNNQHKQWAFTPQSEAIFRSLPGKGWYVLNAELLHSKVPGIRDTNYIHDILVDDGEYLLGSTYAQRYARLLMLLLQGGKPTGPTSHFVLDERTWLAKNHPGPFTPLFESLTRPEDEGLVIKNMQGKLAIKDNAGWAVKCRRPHKNFDF